MITLTLLHPVQGTAVQSWTFNQNQTVRIGRAVDNEVVLYSAVVSRYHVELRHENGCWFVHNLGVNGTFFEGQKIESQKLEDGQTIRLARSGPNIQVHLPSSTSDQGPPKTPSEANAEPSRQNFPRSTEIEYFSQGKSPEVQSGVETESVKSSAVATVEKCNHERTPKSSLICIDCGEPLNVLRNIGGYKVLKNLGDRNTTFQAWKDKKTFILRTLPQELAASPIAQAEFRQQLEQIIELNHGGIPRMLEVIEADGQPYLITEMLYGTSLTNWIKDRGVLSIPSAISWITEIARTLDYLHQQDPAFIHQSVKPSNIIRPTIPQGNHPLILVNFGQSHNIEGFSPKDEDVLFQSPNRQEQAPTVEDDLYGLGATFLFMLTGEDPYKFIQLGDQSFSLQIDDSLDIPASITEVIGRLLHSEGCSPFSSASEALDTFLHLL